MTALFPIKLTLEWSDGREVKVLVGEDLIEDAPAFTGYIQSVLAAMNGVYAGDPRNQPPPPIVHGAS